MARVVVIGAGLAGLTAAIRLADFGHRVTVLEANNHAGGQAMTVRSAGSRRFDAGPAVFTLPAVLRDLFRKTGRPIERCLDLVPAHYGRTFVTTDGTALPLPNADRAGTIETLDRQLGSHAGRQWDDAINAAGRMWDDVRPLLDRPLTATVIARMLTRPALRRATRSSLSRFTDVHLRDPRLQELLHSYAHRFAADPATAPATVATFAYLDQTFGLWTVDGGFGVLIEALLTRVEEKGAAVRFGAAVREIGVRGGKAVAAVTDDATFEADVIVCAAAPAHAYRDLLPRHGRLARTPPTRSYFTVIVDGDPPAGQVTIMDDELPAATVLRAADGATAIHAPCAPHGQDPGEIDWSETQTRAQVDHMLRVATKAGAVASGTARIVHVRTPHDLERQTGAPGGRVSGASWFVTGRALAPRTPFAPVPGALFAGSGVHPGPSVPFSIMSGTIAADYIGRA